MFEERSTAGAILTLHRLPDRTTTVEAQRCERSGAGEVQKFLTAEACPPNEIAGKPERTVLPGLFDPSAGGLPQAIHLLESQTDGRTGRA